MVYISWFCWIIEIEKAQHNQNDRIRMAEIVNPIPSLS